MKPIRILIVDDHFIVCAGLKAGFSGEPDLLVIAEAEDGQQAIERYKQHRPDITLMDLRLPDMSGVEATAAICAADPAARVIVFSTHDGDEAVARALRAGARGYLVKTAPPAEFCQAIRTVFAGDEYLPPQLKARQDSRPPHTSLSPREADVLHLIAKGLSNREIAARLAITEGTVKTHVIGILTKLGVNDRTAAVTTAIQRGVIFLS
jgi:two-component system, NarL family, response regulator